MKLQNLNTARVSTTLLASVLLGTLSLADTVDAGYQMERAAKPAFFAATATLQNGDIVTFDGISVDRFADDGTFIQNLATFPNFVFSSFVEASPAGTGVVVGESSNGELFWVPLDASGPQLLADLDFNYDAVFEDANHLIVSASAGTLGPDNHIARVDMSNGAIEFVALVPGPSGPVDIAMNGDLYYATQDTAFPSNPGTTDVISWTSVQTHSGVLQSPATATVHATGFDGASSMAFDPSTGDLYLAETNFSAASYRLLRVGRNQASSPAIAIADEWMSTVEFVHQGGAASFEAYQPEDGWNLKYNTTDFSNFDDTVTVKPLRPVLTFSGPGATGIGSITFELDNAPPNGTGFLIFGFQTTWQNTEQSYTFPGFLLHTNLTPGAIRRVPFLIPVDANGHGEVTFFNPGTLQGTYGYQYFVGDGTGSFMGSSAAKQL